jgi:hypothetical protein
MTDRATLEALLARVLEGTGPDRELDAEIEACLTGRVTHPRNPGWTFEPQDAEWKLARLADSPFISRAARPAPPFTESLDAVLRDLLPEGWGWAVSGTVNREYHARIVPPTGSLKVFLGHWREAKSAARALIATCLKARMEALGE